MVLGKKRTALLRRRAKTRAQRNHVLLPAHLDDVKRLIQQGSLSQAYEQLKERDEKHPQRQDILFLLATVCRDAYVTEYRNGPGPIPMMRRACWPPWTARAPVSPT